MAVERPNAVVNDQHDNEIADNWRKEDFSSETEGAEELREEQKQLKEHTAAKFGLERGVLNKQG